MKKLFIFLILLSFGILVAFPILAVEFEVNYPTLGGVTPGGGLLVWVQYIFFFALLLTGIAAVGSIIYAGIIYITSGNTERVKDAQARIKAAIIGVILVASSVLVLRIINPDLVNLRQPSVENIFNETFVFVGKSCAGERAIECGIQAGNSTFCHPGTERCTFKVTVGQTCQGPEWCVTDVCDLETNKCSVPFTVCATNEQCPTGSFCDGATFKCTPINN